MKVGSTFMTIGAQKFLAAIFSAEKMLLGIFLVENLHVKLNGALKIRVQCFSNELFSCGKHISAERLFGRNFYF